MSSTALNNEDLVGILSFLKTAEQLKDTLRTAHTSSGRKESTAEHSWRLCLMVVIFSKYYPELDTLRLLKMCIIHDLGEAIHGDVAAVDQVDGESKAASEREDLVTIIEPLPNDIKDEIISLWDEYESANTLEARVAKAFDKLETLLQHTQGNNPKDFNYGFNLSYGEKYTDLDFITRQLRAEIDKQTEVLAIANGTL